MADIGQVVNGYEIITEIARGGMATVYRAHQISMNRDVAIKVLPREFLHEPTFLERFKQEAAIAARLEHRAIVPVYDYGEWDGVPYIVMRHMESGSVDRLIETETIPLDQIQQIMRQVASALDYAHVQGVLHRDLKPSNILLDRNKDAYITDFGIARLMSNNNAKLTSTGVVGTPAYMSPEQAQGHDLDGRSDIYALGVVLYEMLTGRRPFEGDTPYSIAVMHVTKAPPSPRTHKPDIPPGVEMVVMKALEKDRDKRYRTAVEMAGALDDADLLPLAKTAPRMAPQVYTPPPLVQDSFHTQPTPRRIMPAVPLTTPPPKIRHQPNIMAVLAGSFMLAIILGLLLLGVYLVIPVDSKYQEPKWESTAIYRMTATASAGEVSP